MPISQENMNVFWPDFVIMVPLRNQHHRKMKHNKNVCRAHDFGSYAQGQGQIRILAITQKLLKQTSSAGASYHLDYSSARAYCACSRCGGGCLDIFSLVFHFSFLALSLSGRRPDID